MQCSAWLITMRSLEIPPPPSHAALVLGAQEAVSKEKHKQDVRELEEAVSASTQAHQDGPRSFALISACLVLLLCSCRSS